MTRGTDTVVLLYSDVMLLSGARLSIWSLIVPFSGTYSIDHIYQEELSLYHLSITTNNAVESYHTKLKTIIKTHRPRIWTFMTALSNMIMISVNYICGKRFLGQGRNFM